MKEAQEFLKEKGIIPFISFKREPVHIVKLMDAKKDVLIDKMGEEIEGMSFIVEEQGEQRKFFTKSISLIQQLSQYPEGDIVRIEMKSKKSEKTRGGYMSYFLVTAIRGEEEEEEDLPETEKIPEEEIPVIEEEEKIEMKDIPL